MHTYLFIIPNIFLYPTCAFIFKITYIMVYFRYFSIPRSTSHSLFERSGLYYRQHILWYKACLLYHRYWLVIVWLNWFLHCVQYFLQFRLDFTYTCAVCRFCLFVRIFSLVAYCYKYQINIAQIFHGSITWINKANFLKILKL